MAIGYVRESPSRPQRTAFHCLPGRIGFERILPQWDALAARACQLRFMQLPDWYRALFDSRLVDPDDYIFVAAHAGSRMIGVCPLQAGRRKLLGVGIATLGLCKHPHMALADIVIDDPVAHPNLLVDLLAWLERTQPVGCDMLDFEKVPERSALHSALRVRRPSALVSGKSAVSAYLTTDSVENALGPVSTSFLRNLRRLARRAEAEAPLRLMVCQTPETLGPALEHFLALESSGWKGACGCGSAIGRHPRLVSFYRLLTENFGRRGQCVIQLLYHGDIPVAAQFGLIAGGSYNILKIAYSEAHAAFAPGNLLMERAIRWCCKHPAIRELSFVTGPAWSDQWKPRHETVCSYRFFTSTVKGRLVHGALRAKRWLEAFPGGSIEPATSSAGPVMTRA